MNSVKTKGMIFSLSLILIAISALGFIVYSYFRTILVHEINTAVQRVAEESADHLNNYITQFVSPLVGISQDEQIKSMDWLKQQEVLSAQINPYYLNVAVVDRNKTAHYLDGSTLDLSDRDYVSQTFSGKIAFSEVIISRKTLNPVIMVSVPIFRGKDIQGALIARLDVDFLSDYALTRGYGENGRAYIISESGTFISRSKLEKYDDNYNLFVIAAMDKKYKPFSEFVRTYRDQESGYGSYEYEENNILIGYASVAETNWKVYIGTNEEEVLDSLNGVRNIFIIGIIITFVICMLVAWIFVNKFTKPIVELDNLFSLGAKGDLTIRFSPKSKDEIGRVGLSFNRMMDKIKTLTQYDPLTSLLNQFVLEKDVDSLIHNVTTSDFSLIMISINKFSIINETYGYLTGDAILCEVAKRIISCIEEGDQVYRYKGDEFVVLCYDNDTEIKVQKILSILKESYLIEGKIIDTNVNIGTFLWDDSNRSEEPLKAVTQAKNYAKYLGSNQIQKYDQKIYNSLQIVKELQSEIINGLKNNQFFLVFQPLYYLGSEKIAEIEALIRWNHPEKGLLYPDSFIELAEQSGSIINIDAWVLETACKQLRNWKERNKKRVVLSVNISAKSFETKKFIPDLVDMIRFYDVDPTLLQLEITERMVIKNVDESIQKLNELRQMGIHVAIDDFGIGYSSLSYIVRLPIDSIKIDKSFVQNIGSSSQAKTIVSTIINLCKTLQLNVIAEGIESSVELEYLKFNKCDIGQGYYFSRPIPIEEIEKHF